MALPSVVAGPILRRAAEDQVSVWIATTFDPSPGVQLTILDASVPNRYAGLPSTTVRKTIRTGEHLYISLVTSYPIADPPRRAAFPRDVLLAYELWFTFEHPPGAIETVELGQLPGAHGILAYDGEIKPTFYLQHETKLVLLHGSCRKPDGLGNDALPAADTLIGQNVRTLASRPCLLCLTGDQIYANNVHPETLHQIHRWTKDLFGYDESVPADTGMVSLRDLADVRRASKRPKIAKAAGLNPDRWPLFGLGEMLVMYFLSWHVALWDGFGLSAAYGPGSRDLLRRALEISRFLTGLPAVTRAFANAPVYMIFDDHEVTDDWNLYKQWTERVRKSDLGRRTVTNALVAYWLCQGWGNDPSRFDAAFEKQVQEYCELPRTSAGSVAAARSRSYDDFFWDFHDWGYITPTTPPMFVLDTRTQRELHPRGRAPALLSPDAWRAFIKESEVKGSAGFGSKTARIKMRRGDPLLIVVPTPVLGMLFTEASDKFSFLKDGPEAPDFEHWRFNQRAHHEFLKGLIHRFAPKYCVFLSGDVHAAFSAEASYILAAGAIPADISGGPPAHELQGATRFYQFTSSPLKNENHDLAAQVDAAESRLAAEVLLVFRGIDMWDSWDLVGYDRTWRHRVAAKLANDKIFENRVYDRLYVYFMDGQHPDDPFVTMSLLVAKKLQDLNMGRPLWRETGKYFRYINKSRDDAPFYPRNNIGRVTISAAEIAHDLYSVRKVRQLMPPVQRYPYKSSLPR
ncbi:MAG: hypothetical protein ACRD2X_04265 [Vicinamibacteraceae bacterium]